MDTAARVWVCVEKDAWQAALLLHRTKDSAEVILEEDGWAMDSGPSSPRRRKGREREGKLDSKQSTVISLATSSLVLRNPAHLEGSDDLVKLQFLDEPNIIHNLSLRYSAGKIYTSTGPILIAVNPWRNLDIYSAGVMDMYKGQASGQLPPHVFGVADSAYRAMLREQRNQVCFD
jgi:myosin heavy subunit